MSSFTTPLAYRAIVPPAGEPEDIYVLTEPFTYEVGELGSGLTLTVAAGFITDLASVPWPLRLLFRPDGAYAKAAVIHDFLYDRGLVSRWMADRIFLEGMKVLKVHAVVRLGFYVAVRACGWLWWQKGPFLWRGMERE